jgi:hypothetical protein
MAKSQRLKPEPSTTAASALDSPVSGDAGAEAAAPGKVAGPEEIARLAYEYWEARGGAGGSSEEDWFRAERELRSRPLTS